MPRFFTNNIIGDRIIITGEDARHISLSLRARQGESLTVSNGNGTDYATEIESIDRETVTLRVINSFSSPGEPSVSITLFQAMAKGDKMDSIVMKSVELGVSSIVPLITGRCVSRPRGSDTEKKLLRYRRIALEAAKQCGRGRIPEVLDFISLSGLEKAVASFERVLFCYEGAKQPLSGIDLNGCKSLALIVGPEGGFEAEEARFITDLGAFAVSLGSRILRCETAPIAALSACLYALGEM